jgi:N-acetylneuraminate lyase
MRKYEGVFPAIVTPMDSNGDFNEEAFRKVIELNINVGVDGFWVAGGNGESILLSDEENMRVVSAAADQNKGRINNIMHVGAPTTERSIKLATHAASVGAEAICSVPPFFYPQSDDAIVEHYRVIAAAADLPFFVYNLPQSTNVEITPELMKKIADKVPQLMGLKHSAHPSFTNIPIWDEMSLKCFTGNALLMLPALTIGAIGCIDGPLCAIPELWIDIWNAWQNKDIETAQKAQKKASRFAALLRKLGPHSSAKAVLSERLGIDCGSARLPTPPISEEGKKILLEHISNLGIKI